MEIETKTKTESKSLVKIDEKEYDLTISVKE